MSKSVIVIGAGFSGLSAAACLAQKGYLVTLLEKHPSAGGRARSFTEKGFTFDMGPSWYWMPEVFEKFYARFGKKVSDFYDLERLDPSYYVYWGKQDFSEVPAKFDELIELFESMDPGSGPRLVNFLNEAKYKYEVGINKLVYKPGRSLLEFADWELIKGALKLDVFNNLSSHARKVTKHPKLIQILEFPVLFLGATPENTPALYSLMNYADLVLGTWFPKGGMIKIVDAMVEIANSQGVEIKYNCPVNELIINNNNISGVVVNGQTLTADIIISSADYHFTETNLIPKSHRSYSEKYWESRTMAPSSLLYYIGLNKKLINLAHHNLFFDMPFKPHAEEIYSNPSWPQNPLFYASITTKTDLSGAPDNCENLFLLIPVAAGLKDTDEIQEIYFNKVIERLELNTGQSIKEHIIYRRDYAYRDFVADYGAFKGNAYGLANTLKQTAILKPSLKSKKINNLFYTGQLTVPGPGVPPALISGQVVSSEIEKLFPIVSE
jgi:phytoene desaturase